MKNKSWLLSVALMGAMLVAAGCSVDYPDAPDDSLPRITTSGNADFTKFVTIGNSLTAGYQNSGLSQKFQVNSYGAIIARQLGIEDAGYAGSDFEQPLVADPGTSGILYLNTTTTKPTPVTNPSNNFTNLTLARPYDNLGIPLNFLYDYLNAADTNTSWTKTRFGKANALYLTILRGLGTQHQQMRALNPSFVIWWEGHNDVLGYATSGAGLNGDFTAITNVSPYTPVNTSDPLAAILGYDFTTGYARSLDSVLASGADAVTGNIPDVTDIPYFTALYPGTTFPVKDSLVTNVLTGTRAKVYYEENVDSIRFLCFALGGVIGTGTVPYGLASSNPVRGNYTLTYAEVRNIQAIIGGYNQVIAAVAGARGVPVVDFYSIFKSIATNGLTLDGGFVVGSSYLSGGMFSLDGVHPNSLGYAVVANEFISKINETYGSDIPEVNVSRYVIVK